MDGLYKRLRYGMLVILLGAAIRPARAQNPWEQLPPTPSLPRPERIGMVPANGVRIWYAIYSQGAPVILLHGGMANSNYWGLQIPALAPHYQVIAIDSRGQGRSTWDYRPISYHLMASDVIAVMDALYISKAALVGWSDGAIIGIDIAIHHPERLTKLFAFGANSNLDGVKSAEGNAVFAEYDARTRAEYQNISAAPADLDRFTQAMNKMWNSEPDFSDADLRSIKVATWIVDGEYDEIIKREDNQRFDAAIARLERNGALRVPGHMIMVSTRALVRFPKANVSTGTVSETRSRGGLRGLRTGSPKVARCTRFQTFHSLLK